MRREHFRSAPSCPADRWLLPATCCTLSWPPLLLPALTCANGSRPKRLSSSRTQVGCSGAQCLRSGSHTFYMLLTLSYMDNPLGDFSQLPNSGSSARARPPSLARRPTLAGLSIGPPSCLRLSRLAWASTCRPAHAAVLAVTVTMSQRPQGLTLLSLVIPCLLLLGC